MHHALVAAALATAITLVQATPGFLAQTEGTTPGDWTDAQVDSWWLEAEAYLADHPEGADREDTYRLMLDLAWYRDEKTGRAPLDVARRYLAEYPDGAYHDEMDWKRVYFEHWAYEYEEDLPRVLRDATAFADYLALHPQTTVADAIKLEIGWRYQIAYEVITYGPDPDTGFSADDATAFRRQAVALWREVQGSKLPQVAQRARYFLEDEWVYYAFPPRHAPPEPEPKTVTFVASVGDDGSMAWQRQDPGINLPEIVHQGTGQHVVWQAASAVPSWTDTSPEDLPLALRRPPDTAAGECESVVAFSDRWGPAPSRVDNPTTVAEMVEWATAGVEGVVVGATGGFLSGLPGQMLEVRVTRALKPSPEYTGPTWYVFYPQGEVIAGGRRQCRSSRWLPPAPEVGDSIVVLPRYPPVTPDYPIVELMGSGVEVVFGKGKVTNIPTHLLVIEALSSATRFNHVLRAIRKAARAHAANR